MSAKAKPTARREVFGRNVAPPQPVAPAATIKTPPEPLTTAKVKSTAMEAPAVASERREPTNEAVTVLEMLPHESVPSQGSGGGLRTTSPFTEAATFVDPSPRPSLLGHAAVKIAEANLELVATHDEPMVIETPPVRRGHIRAKVLVHGLNCTGYTLNGEYRVQWRKDDEGEFIKASVDGIYLEAL